LRLAAGLGWVLLLGSASSQEPHPGIPLPTSKQIHASPQWQRTNSFPAAIALSPDGRYAALLNHGYGALESGGRQSISILDRETGTVADFPDPRLGENARQTYFLGLAFSADGQHLYASLASITDPTGVRPGSTGNGIAVYSFREGKVSPERFLPIAPQKLTPGKRVAYGLRQVAAGSALPYPAGLAVISAASGEQLLVANNLSDSVVLLEAASGRILRQFDLSTSALVPSAFPYTVIATRDGRRAWCSLWNASRVAELDLTTGRVARWISLLEPKDPIAPGSHPTALLLSSDEKQLYVALTSADSVAVLATGSGKVLRYLSTRLPGQEFPGSDPNALARSEDGKRLFVANASANAVAVFDTTTLNEGHASNTPDTAQSALGFIPAGWYPSALAVRGDELLVANGKGEGTGPNRGPDPLTPSAGHRPRKHAYIGNLLRGSIARFSIRQSEQNLEGLTRQTREENLLTSAPGKIEFRQGANPIRHVIYVLKENRSYDQLFGDLKVGDGDPSLTLYGEEVTPNHHRLALQFGVLDNFYDSGEVSGNGHVWSSAAITSDYNEKTWQITYRGKERTYDFGGTVADEYPLENAQPDVDDPQSGFLWDNLARHGKTYRDYGEFVNARWCVAPGKKPPKPDASSPFEAPCERPAVRQGEPLPANLGQPHGSASPWPWPVPLMQDVKATKAVLRDHFDSHYPDFNVDYPDQLRADEFLNEFEGFVRARQEGKGTGLPEFVLLYLPADHTAGTRPGKPRPTATVADNDLALGRVVQAVSNSPYWDDTAIFVIEDDAQDGADHVDAHRSIALAISKYSPGNAQQPFVDHNFYTTVSMIHTIETLLGLPPMNQNDAYAPVMAPLFSGPGDQPPFQADYRNRDNGLLYATNKRHAPGAKQSARMDFSRPDAVNTPLLNRILWRDRKGSSPMPPPRHQGVPVKSGGKRDWDD
jgi:DNA-binding beta-propeller fold protein YncE